MELLEKLQEYEAWIERDTSVSIKRLHSDQEGEYKKLGDYPRKKGIVQTFFTAYTPQSNGLAERFNRTLLDKVRSMLVHAGLPLNFWGEGALHASFLTNITGSSAIDGRTPYEIIHGSKPDVRKLRIFGCAAFVNIPKENQSMKLSSRSKHGVFMGIRNGLYQVYCFDKREIYTSKHVVIDESKYPAKDQSLKTEEDLEEIGLDEGIIELSSLTPLFKENNIEPKGNSLLKDETSPRYPTRERNPPDYYRAGAAITGETWLSLWGARCSDPRF